MLVDYDVFVNVPRLDAQQRHRAACLQGGGFRLPAEGWLRCNGQGHAAARRHGRLHRASAGSGALESGQVAPHLRSAAPETNNARRTLRLG